MTLHQAAADGHAKFCLSLLKEGAEVDALDGFDSTPLAAVMLTYSLIQVGGVYFEEPHSRRQVEARLSHTVRILLAHGADPELIRQSLHGPFSPQVEAWVQTIDAQRRSDEELASLDQKTARATRKSRSSRL
ncbi:MAG: hypothetical protein ACTHOC_01885 [Luteimonas sp.]